MSAGNKTTHPYGMITSEAEVTLKYGATIIQPDNVIRRIKSASVSAKQRPNIQNVEEEEQRQQGQQQLSRETHSVSGRQLPHDSLEYFIKFPSPSYRDEASTTIAGESDDFVFVDNEQNVPIIMLLGWAGCQDRYLMKYSKIYEDRGLITVRYTAPVDTLFWRRSDMIPIGEKILKLIQDMNFDEHPLIFHIFSNGGAFLYQHISLAVRKHKSPLEVRGVIFDSAPGERRILGLYRAISAIYGRDKRKCNTITAAIITLTLSFMWFLEETFSAFKSLFVKSDRLQCSPFCELKNEANISPQLFLYSKGDVVIPYKDIEKFIKLRQNHGVEVSSVCFEDAEHVKIYTKYPSQYIKCVCNFINNCMSHKPFSHVNEDLMQSPSPTTTNTALKLDN